MSVKKYKPLSPDPYVGKIKGDTEFARLAHLNDLVDQVNTQFNNVTPSGLPLFDVDLASEDYNATSAGIYTIIDHTSPYAFNLPSPASLPGQTIYVINPSIIFFDVPFGVNIPVTYDGVPGGSSVFTIPGATIIQLLSIGGVWVANKFIYS